jgi:oligoribonuclease NrnB/cAMP/cGMP phosphodiesterase (DHH superfamily)
MQVGLWFDHHEGNLEELEYRKIDTESIPGRFSPDPSCARVVYGYFSEHMELPSHFSEMVREADDIDSFNFSSIDEWRRETPGKIIDGTLRLQHEKPDVKWQFMRQLVGHLKERSLPEVAKLPSIKKRYRVFQEEESRMLQQIKDNSTFLEQDPDQQMVVIDLTPHKKRQFVIKNLAYILYPKALAVIEVKNLFQNNIKTNNLSFSMSLSIKLNNRDHNKDVGLIMRELNIGGGHKGAGAGTIHCDTKDEMIREKQALLDDIYDLFKTQ